MASHGNAAILVTVMCPPDICPWNGAAGGFGGGSSRVTQPVTAWQANVSAGFLVIPFPTFGYFGGEGYFGWASLVIPFASVDVGKTTRGVVVHDTNPAEEPIVVEIRVPWTMPTDSVPHQPTTATSEEYQKARDAFPYENVDVHGYDRQEIQRILDHSVYFEESMRVLDESVRAKAELGALRVYRETQGVHGVYSVGTPTTTTSMTVPDPDPLLGDHVFDAHPHPLLSAAKSEPSLKDIRTSAKFGRPGVILYKGGVFGNANGTTIYQGACKPDGDC